MDLIPNPHASEISASDDHVSTDHGLFQVNARCEIDRGLLHKQCGLPGKRASRSAGLRIEIYGNNDSGEGRKFALRFAWLMAQRRLRFPSIYLRFRAAANAR